MPTFKRTVLALMLTALLSFPGCAGRRPELCYDLTLSDFKGAEGYALVYDISATMLWVTLNDDFGNPPKLLWSTRLSPDQQASFAHFARELPLNQLRDRYEDTSVFDGYKYTYRLRIGENAPREISVNNVAQPQLDPLIELINDVVPEKYRAASPRSAFIPQK